MTISYVITGGTTPDGHQTDVAIDANGNIAQLGPNITADGADIIDATGKIVLPGLVDLHTHLREPGSDDAETVETGTRAAAKGGFTAVHAMANSNPVADTAGVVEQVHRLGKASGWADVYPVGAVTVGLAGEKLAEISAMHDSTANVTMFSDDGMCVWDPVLMRRALEYVKSFDGFIAQHAQEPRLTEGAQMNESALSSELGLAGWPAVAEESIIARDVLLAQHVDSRVHICHVSTAGSVELIRWAKSQGIHVTAEVTPHHLLLTEDYVKTYDPVYKVNPPLRKDSDVLALRQGLADGTIDTVGTDHAPHTAQSKQCEWVVAAMGMTGLETALPVIQHTMVETGLLDWHGVARVMWANPARIYRHEDQGQLSETGGLVEGAVANIAIYDSQHTFVVNPTEHASKSSNSPYNGMELSGQVTDVFYRGQRVVADALLMTPYRHN